MTVGRLSSDSATALPDTVREIWNDVLGVTGASSQTFFELGGQSISAVRITARVEEELGVEVGLGDLFEDPDLDAFVAIVSRAADARGTRTTDR
ncbi:phosphopantetheine-binding protein [Micromonospora profundi]|uniref:Phosphopantetheine-binding protein n=1 Tax=Micromonospora profundi TaxID=1420889 RepID=A0AAJ6HRL1_9ACTN|nr:phosphopantetheine-binding protein [Micromonospora profundi]WLS43313.1 phosphopantetheine-binding protein [Micromonospora profundi]